MRHVVVTGGGTGIGYAVARRFAEEHVTILGRRPDVLKQAADELDAAYVVCDAADPDSVTAALDALPEQVDVLVNNAGGNTDLSEPATDPADSAPADSAEGSLAGVANAWRRNLDANVLSAVLVTTALRPRFNDGARVVTIGSIAARNGAGSYGAAKAAVEAWTADLAADLGAALGGTANVVSPGLTVHTEFFHGKLSDERRQALIAATRTGRACTPDDIAGTVHFLAGAEAAQLSGQVLHVNGGAYLGR